MTNFIRCLLLFVALCLTFATTYSQTNDVTLPATTNVKGRVIIGGIYALSMPSFDNLYVGGAGNFNLTNSNVGVGKLALQYATTGSYNTVIGTNAFRTNSTGSRNVWIGYDAGNNATFANLSYRGGIDVTNTTCPLLGFDFNNDTVYVCGTLKVSNGIIGGGGVTPSDTCLWYLSSVDISDFNLLDFEDLDFLTGGEDYLINKNYYPVLLTSTLTIDSTLLSNDEVFFPNIGENIVQRPSYVVGWDDVTGELSPVEMDSIPPTSRVYKEELATTKVIFTLSFPLTSSTLVSFNGVLLRDTQWDGIGTTTLTLYLDTKENDYLLVKQ